MKKKYWIAGTAAVIVLIAAIVLLLMQNNNNNSESRIQNSELNAEAIYTAVPDVEGKKKETVKETATATEEPKDISTVKKSKQLDWKHKNAFVIKINKYDYIRHSL